MATTEQTTSVEILLSREELLYVLNLLQARFLPGLDEGPDGELTGEQRALALRVAGRALQARELVRLRSNGDPSLHTSLLRAVGVCAYAQSTVFAYHWAANTKTPVRTFFHIRGNDGVMHTSSDPSLHRFALIPVAQIPALIAETCHIKPKDSQSDMEILVSNEAFLAARQQMGNGDIQAAQQSLEKGGAGREAAALFASSLSNSSAVSILQIVNQNGSSVQKRDITIVQNGVRGWIVEPKSAEDEGQLRVKALQMASFEKAVGL